MVQHGGYGLESSFNQTVALPSVQSEWQSICKSLVHDRVDRVILEEWPLDALVEATCATYANRETSDVHL